MNVLVCYCCIRKYHTLGSLKQHKCISSQFCMSEVWHGMNEWVLCYGYHKAETRISTGLSSCLVNIRKNLLPCSFLWLAEVRFLWLSDSSFHFLAT